MLVSRHQVDLANLRGEYQREQEAHDETEATLRKKTLDSGNQNLSVEVRQLQFELGEAEAKLKAEETIRAKLEDQLEETRAKVERAVWRGSIGAAADQARERDGGRVGTRSRHGQFRPRGKGVVSQCQGNVCQDGRSTIAELNARIEAGAEVSEKLEKELRQREAELRAASWHEEKKDEEMGTKRAWLRSKGPYRTEKRRSELHETRPRSSEEFQDLRAKATELVVCKHQLAAAKWKMQKTEAELDNLRPKASELVSYQTLLTEVQGSLGQHKAELESAKSLDDNRLLEIQKAAEELEELRPKAVELEDCKTRLDSARKEVTALQEGLDGMQSLEKTKSQDLEKAQNELEEIRPRVEALMVRTQSLEAEKGAQARRVKELEGESAEKTRRETALQKQLEMRRVRDLEEAARQEEAGASEVRRELEGTKTSFTVTTAVLKTLEISMAAWFEGRQAGALWRRRRTGRLVGTLDGGCPLADDRVAEPPDCSCLRDRVARVFWLASNEAKWNLDDMSIALELLASISKDAKKNSSDTVGIGHMLRVVREPFLRKTSSAMHLRVLAAFALGQLATVVGVEPVVDETSKGRMLLPLAIEEATERCGRENGAAIKGELLMRLPDDLRVVGDLGIYKEEGEDFMVAVDFSSRVIWAIDLCHAQQIRNFPYSELVIESPDTRRGGDLIWRDPGMKYEVWWTIKLLPPKEINVDAMEPYVPLFT
ncbi:uncharacterized protein PG986_000821 [Apiospora aurea]|uniref:Uncharacterized protein n=1 Tax=Apiospora aurea TaxID=335848 RepID=A0ABR1QV57_9PEZI